MVVQHLELVSRRGPGVQSLVGELRSHELCSLGKKKKKKKKTKEGKNLPEANLPVKTLDPRC